MTVDLTSEELEALHYVVAVLGIEQVPPSLRTAALTAHAKIERACTAATDGGEVRDPAQRASARSR